MARDTDRQIIARAMAQAIRTKGDVWTVHDEDFMNIQNEAGHELEICFSMKGRISHLVHWQPIETGSKLASRQPIHLKRREHVLAVIAGTWEP